MSAHPADVPPSPTPNTWSVLIRYPRFVELHRLLTQCQQLTQAVGEPQCMSLEGQAGVGKSTWVQDYLRRFPRRQTRAGLQVPVLSLMVPAPATIKSITAAMLAALGDPAAHKGTQWSMAQRLVKFLPACKVQLVVLDDFHHLIDRERNRVLESVADWLKVLIKQTGTPFLVVGMEGTVEQILRPNAQLSRLFAVRETLRPFAWPQQQAEFAKFVGYVERSLARPLTAALPREDLLQRLYLATDGVVGNVLNLWRYALWHAEDHATLELADLAWAYQTRLARHVGRSANPFLDAQKKSPPR